MANETTSTTLDDLFANIIMQARFTAEEQSLMLGLVTRYDIAGQAGKTIQVPKYPAVAAANLVEGTDMSATEVSTSSVVISVGEVGAQVVLTDMAAMGAGNPAQDLGTVLGSSIATKIDSDLIALFPDFTAAIGAAGAAITVADIFAAAATLSAANAPGQYAAVLHPYQAYDLKSNMTNTFADPNGGDLQNEAMRTGYVGRLAGVSIYESSNVALAGTDATGAVFAPEALAIAMKREFNIETERNASLRAWELNATAAYGVGMLDDTYGAEVTTKSAL